MSVNIINNPLLKHTLNTIRVEDLSPDKLRLLVENLTIMALPYVFEREPLVSRVIKTPLEEGTFEFFEEENYCFVCILRAGLPMLWGALKVLPQAKAGFLAIRRDEETLSSKIYYSRLPDLEDKSVVLLDPMLATGGTLSIAIEELKRSNPRKIKSLHLVASTQGVKRVKSMHPDVELYVVSVDRELNSKGYIVPGVGDMGDRLFSEGL
ncbi:MAG: uracil phosphoribosyltransferase [Aquificota bacterium]|nr:MAG: uracil phosphoribosyltransferase [Aquificota bacterium]